jgi:hypothetical protein
MNKETLWVEFYKIGLIVGTQDNPPTMYDEEGEEEIDTSSAGINAYACAYAEACTADFDHKFSSSPEPTIKTSERLSTLTPEELGNIALSYRHDYGLLTSMGKELTLTEIRDIVNALVNTLSAKGE